MPFACPLRLPPFGAPLPSLRSAQDVNEAVRVYRAAATAPERARHAQALYLQLLPLVKKTLARFCVVSVCDSSACYPAEIVGESYLVFQAALDDYDPAYGVDFLGYLAMRLHRGLRHRVETLVRAHAREAGEPPLNQGQRGEDEEVKLLDQLFVKELLHRLEADDANLLRLHHAEGFPTRELAERTGSSDAAVRKRLERARMRLRQALEP